MRVDALRFAGEVFDSGGVLLGEARFWVSSDRDAEAASWRGWLRVTDLGTTELSQGRYHVRAFEGWEAEFEPLTNRPSRVYEIDLLPIRGTGDPPWPDQSSDTTPRYQPLWDTSPPRTADDRAYFPDFGLLGPAPRDGLLPPGLPWAPVPEE